MRFEYVYIYNYIRLYIYIYIYLPPWQWSTQLGFCYPHVNKTIPKRVVPIDPSMPAWRVKLLLRCNHKWSQVQGSFRNLQTFGRFLKSGLYIYMYIGCIYSLYIYMYTISIWLYLDTFGCCFGTLLESFERPLSIYELIPVGKMPLAALCSGKMELAILLLATCSCQMLIYSLPSGKPPVCYWKLPFIVDLRIKHGDFP